MPRADAVSYVCPGFDVDSKKIVCGQWREAQLCRGACQTLRRVGSCCGVCADILDRVLEGCALVEHEIDGSRTMKVDVRRVW
jgi:hypothetical protein